MLKLCLVYYLFSVIFVVVRCRYISIDKYGRDLGVDDALFLTPYIENGRIEEGRNLSKVSPMLEGIESFSGYLTVNKTTSSNLFFWLFKCQEGKWEKRPLVVWLQGGPGSSSLFGLFTEIGPFSVTENQELRRRNYSWNRKYNLVFIDNPVGAGFSFTKMNSGYARNESDVARDLYEALDQLYKLFPALHKNKLIIAGESYAGKYIPAIAYKIFQMNQVAKKPKFKINLAGLMIGNGFTDPKSMLEHASYVYELGLIDRNVKNKLLLNEKETRALINDGNFEDAAIIWNNELDAILNETGFRYLYDFIHDELGMDGPEMRFINDPKIKKAIHVGKNGLGNGEVLDYLSGDIMQSVKPWVEELLTAEQFPIMFYSGQFDIIVPYTLSLEFYRTLQWPRSGDYQKAKRCIFQVGGEVAGYYKTAGTFTEVMVRNAGHMVPTTQPKWMFELMDRFISNSAYFSKCP